MGIISKEISNFIVCTFIRMFDRIGCEEKRKVHLDN